MLDVLLVRIQPNDVVSYNRPDDFEFFNDKTLDFNIKELPQNVSNLSKSR